MNAIELKKEQKFESLSTRDTNLATVPVPNMIFQELYYQADFNCGGRLPIHVTFMLDEFANGVTRSTPKTVGITDKSVA